jgi:hypothetical protein
MFNSKRSDSLRDLSKSPVPGHRSRNSIESFIDQILPEFVSKSKGSLGTNRKGKKIEKQASEDEVLINTDTNSPNKIESRLKYQDPGFNSLLNQNNQDKPAEEKKRVENNKEKIFSSKYNKNSRTDLKSVSKSPAKSQTKTKSTELIVSGIKADSPLIVLEKDLGKLNISRENTEKNEEFITSNLNEFQSLNQKNELNEYSQEKNENTLSTDNKILSSSLTEPKIKLSIITTNEIPPKPPTSSKISPKSKKSPLKPKKKEDLMQSIDEVLMLNTSVNCPKKKSELSVINEFKPKYKKYSMDDTPVSNLSDLSKEILSKKKEKGQLVYSQMYKIANRPRPDISPPKDFKNKSPTRNAGEIDKSLYEDAQRRASIHYEPFECSEVTTSIKSQQVLLKRFTKELLDSISKFNISVEKITFDDLISLFQSLNFIKSNPQHCKYEEEYALALKFWKRTCVNEFISIEKLLSSCLASIGIFISQVLDEISIEPPIDTQKLLSALTTEQEHKFHKLFYKFHENRMFSIKKYKQKPAKEPSFKPTLSPETKALAKRKRNEIGITGSQKRLDYFLQEKKKTLEKAEKFKTEKEEEEAKNCTFKPKILKKNYSNVEISSQDHRTLILYEKSKKNKEPNIKSSQEIELEKNLAECTFVPQINKQKIKEKESPLYSKSVLKQIERLQKGREEETRKKLILQSRSTNFEKDLDRRPNSPLKPPIYRSGAKSPEKMMPVISLVSFENLKDEQKIEEEVEEDHEDMVSEKPPN